MNRKGPKKNVQNLDDVVKRLNELDPESEVIPCFVARDLGNLPPITFNSIDVSVLLAKIESMHDEVQLMRGIEGWYDMAANYSRNLEKGL